MKKLALSSLVAVFAVSAANAGVIDGNPLYMPKAGHFYSLTGVETATSNVDAMTIGEEFGYGITDRFTAKIATSISQQDWFKDANWDVAQLGLTYRVINDVNWKLDAVAEYGFGPMLYNDGQHTRFFEGSFLNKDHTQYLWTVGVRGGYVGHDFTVAGHMMMDYMNSESFNWDENKWDANNNVYTGLHTLRVGIDGQLLLNQNWNLVSGAEYTKLMDHYSDKATVGSWELTFGANYNFDATKFIGAYITKDIEHVPVAGNEGNWRVQDGFGFGAKFGIDF